MPVHRVSPKLDVDESLVAALVDTLKKNQEKGPPDEPDITIEEVLPSRSLHVTVLWDRWGALSGEQRGRVIVEAFRRAFGETEMLRMTSALGLTRLEADRLGVVRSAG